MRQHVCVIIHNLLDLYLTVDSYDTTIYHTSNIIFLCSTSETDRWYINKLDTYGRKLVIWWAKKTSNEGKDDDILLN